MNNISMNQALGIWDELWQAYYNDNGYGGDTAEIYAYRLMPNIPTLNLKIESLKVETSEAYKIAQSSLYNLLEKFGHENDCIIKVNGKTLRQWLKTEFFTHRCHVQIIRRDK